MSKLIAKNAQLNAALSPKQVYTEQAAAKSAAGIGVPIIKRRTTAQAVFLCLSFLSALVMAGWAGLPHGRPVPFGRYANSVQPVSWCLVSLGDGLSQIKRSYNHDRI